MANEAKKLETVRAPVRKKLSVDKIDVAKQPVGFSFKGKYVGTSESEPFSKVDDKGVIETKVITFAIFERVDGSRFKVARDKGLYSAMKDSMIKEGDLMEAVKGEKSAIKGGARTMNTWDIYSLETLE